MFQKNGIIILMKENLDGSYILMVNKDMIKKLIISFDEKSIFG
jgi:hypothetical protein